MRILTLHLFVLVAPAVSSIDDAFSPEQFRRQGHAIVDMLADQLNESLTNPQQPVVELTNPETAYDEMAALLDSFSQHQTKDLTALFREVYRRSIRLHHPKYIGHQISPPLPVASLASLMCDLLNNGMGVFEMGVAGTAIERLVVKTLAAKMDYPDSADGYLTSGGTLGNLTALLAARRAKASPDVWSAGHHERLALLVSDQAHYCVDKAARVMGWGEEGTIKIPTDDQFRMRIDQLEPSFKSAQQNGRRVIAVVGSACSTATGSYDDLPAIANFCQQHDLWFHVDGAHGAAAIYSDPFKHCLDGIEKADSMVMDFHKLLMTPALATAVIFKDARHGAQNFSQQADYLWEQSNQHPDQWHDLAKRTFECTKTMIGLKIFTILAMHGEEIFNQNVTRLFQAALDFAELIESQPDFELAIRPQSNIVCFRYSPTEAGADLNELNKQIRAALVEQGKFYIVQTTLKHTAWFRCTVANPFTNRSHFEELLATIRSLGAAAKS